MKKLILMLMLCAPMTMMAQKFGKVNTQTIIDRKSTRLNSSHL